MLTAKEKRDLLMGRYEAKRQQIDSRIAADIECYRKGDCRIKVADGAGVSVKVSQKTHDFKFGANIFMLDEFPTEAENEKYRAFFKEMFNLATVPFYWDGLEPEEGKRRYEKDSPRVYRRPAPEKCMEYCDENGIDTKAHCLVYDKFVPDWLVKLPLGEVEKKYEERFAEIAGRYRGRMYEFEVINELLAESDWPYKTALSGKRDILEWSFALAKKYFPGETLVLNETTSRIGLDTKGYRSPYFQLVENALLKGVPVDKVGIQHHMFTGAGASTQEEYDEAIRKHALRHNPEGILRALDIIWELGVPLEITEVTVPTFGETPEDEQLQADLMKLWYSIWFSHPGMSGIVYWNTVDKTAWINPNAVWNENNCRGGLLHRDLTPKKSALMLKKLLWEDWRTELTLTTDEEGYISFRGFYGDYEAVMGDCVLSFGVHKEKKL